MLFGGNSPHTAKTSLVRFTPKWESVSIKDQYVVMRFGRSRTRSYFLSRSLAIPSTVGSKWPASNPRSTAAINASKGRANVMREVEDFRRRRQAAIRNGETDWSMLSDPIKEEQRRDFAMRRGQSDKKTRTFRII